MQQLLKPANQTVRKKSFSRQVMATWRAAVAMADAARAGRSAPLDFDTLLDRGPEEAYGRAISAHFSPGLIEQGVGAFCAPQMRAVAEALDRQARRVLRLRPEVREKVFSEILAAFRDRVTNTASQATALLLNAARIRGEVAGNSSEERAAQFSKMLLDKNYRGSCRQRFPIVDETLNAMTEDAIRCVDQFFDRLIHDWKFLEEIVPDGLGIVENIRFYAGDPHNGGQSVILVRGTQGSIVYKPRSLDTDVVLSKCIDWLETKLEMGLRHVKVLSRPDYGWTSFVAASDCASVEEVETCYRRTGALMGMIFTLGGADIHHENIICAGAVPFIVDAEALLHGALNAPTRELRRRQRARLESLMNTCYLPCLIKMGETGVDISGAGYREGQTIRLKRAIRPDGDRDISAQPYDLKTPRSFNTPSINHQPTRAADHVGQIEEGYSAALTAIISHREELLGHADLLPSFGPVTSRYIPRATAEYGRIARDALHPHACATRAKHDDSLSVLAGRIGWTARTNKVLLAADLAAIRRGDIPFFKARAGSRSLWTSDGVEIPNVFQESGIASVRRRIRQLEARHVERDRAIIRLAFSASAGARDLPALVARQSPNETPVDTGRTAASIGDHLLDLSIEADGHLYWLGRSLVDDRFTCAMIEGGLYEGVAGIGIFLAELARSTRDERHRRGAERCLRTIRDSNLAMREGIGAFEGPVGLAYAEMAISDALNLPLSSLAGDILNRASNDVEADRSFDIIGGSAGTLLVALRARGTPYLRDVATKLANRCADHLVQHAESMNENAVAWRVSRWDRPLTGLAHGTCGISMALGEYALLFDDARAWKTAIAGLRYARGSFDTKTGLWRDLRHAEGHMIAWCHGAPGMVLARQRLVELAPGLRSGLRGDIRRGLGAMLGQPGLKSDTFCHGKVGNWEALWRGGKLHARRVQNEAANICRLWFEQRRLNGDLSDPTPDLMNGLAGVGLQLLRHHDRSVPSVATLGLRNA